MKSLAISFLAGAIVACGACVYFGAPMVEAKYQYFQSIPVEQRMLYKAAYEVSQSYGVTIDDALAKVEAGLLQKKLQGAVK